MSDNEVSYEQLIAFAAGELDPAQAEFVERHLKSHPEGAKTVARYRVIRCLLSANAEQAPSFRATTRAQALFRQLWHKHKGALAIWVFLLFICRSLRPTAF